MSGFASQGELLMSLITKDGSGQISRDDLGAAMKKAGLPTEQLDALLDVLDVDGDGWISEDELLKVAGNFVRHHTPSPNVAIAVTQEQPNEVNPLHSLFSLLGERGGYLEEDDVLDALFESGIEDPEDRMSQLMDAIDTDGDGKISRKELITAMEQWGVELPPGAHHDDIKEAEEAEDTFTEQAGGISHSRGSSRRRRRRSSWLLDDAPAGEAPEANAMAMAAAEAVRQMTVEEDGPAMTSFHTQKSIDYATEHGDGVEQPDVSPVRSPRKHDHNAILREMQYLFSEADVDGDGSIGIAEFVTLIQNWDGAFSDQFARDIFDEIDLDGNGELDFEEFAEAFEKLIEMSTDGEIHLENVGANLTGIEAAEFKAAKHRALSLEQDLVKQKLQHQAEVRELKQLSASFEDQLDQSFAEFQEQLESKEAKEKALADRLNLTQSERDMEAEKVKQLERELLAEQAGKRSQAALLRQESTALDDQLSDAQRAQQELEEENSVFVTEVDRLNGLVNALREEGEAAMAILKEVQDEKEEAERRLTEENESELEGLRREVEEYQSEADNLRAELAQFEDMSDEQKRNLHDSMQSKASDLSRASLNSSKFSNVSSMANDKLERAEAEVERLKQQTKEVAQKLNTVTEGKKVVEAKLAEAEAHLGRSGGASAAAIKERDLARAQLEEASRKANKLQADLASSVNDADRHLADHKLTMTQLSKALTERDTARSDLEGALADAKETMKLREERDAALKEAAEAKSKAVKITRERSGSVNRRRSLSTSSAGGEGAEAAELRRKLELKMAELSKYKTQLKAEKTKARRLERERQAEEAEATRGDTELEMLRGALGRSKEMDGILTKAASLLYPNGLSQEELDERLLHHPGAGKVMKAAGNWSGADGVEDMDLRQNHTYFVNASSTANASGMVMAYNTTDAQKGMVPGDIFRDADPATTRALFASSPWWLDTKRLRPPAPAAAARAAAARATFARAAPVPAGHTGRRVWNEELQFFEDRSTAPPSAAQSTVPDSSDHFSEPELESDHDFIDDAAAIIRSAAAASPAPSPAAAAAPRAVGSTTYDLAARGLTPDVASPTPAGGNDVIRPLQITRLGSATQSAGNAAAMRASLEGRTSSGRSPVPQARQSNGGSARPSFQFSTASRPATVQLGLVETNTHL